MSTGKGGRYELPIDDDDIIFVIKPRGYMTPVDALNLPRFYYIHKPAGSPGSCRASPLLKMWPGASWPTCFAQGRTANCSNQHYRRAWRVYADEGRVDRRWRSRLSDNN